MPWFRVDDSFCDHPKVLALSASPHCHEALALWLMAGTWSAKHLENGAVPVMAVKRLGASVEAAEALVECGLWLGSEAEGYRFRNWSKYQPTSAEVKAKRKANNDRVKRHRQRKSNASQPPPSNGDVTHYKQEPEQRAYAPPVPTRPDPTHSSLRSEESRGGLSGSARYVRQAFAERFASARAVPWSHAKYTSELEQVGGWLSQLGGEFGEHLERLLGGFFGDDFAAQRGYPFGLLAKDPARYHSPPAPQLSPEELEAEQNRAYREEVEAAFRRVRSGNA